MQTIESKDKNRIGLIIIITIPALFAGNLLFLQLKSLTPLFPANLITSVKYIGLILTPLLFIFSLRLYTLTRSRDYLYLTFIACITAFWYAPDLYNHRFGAFTANIETEVLSVKLAHLFYSILLVITSFSEGIEMNRKKYILFSVLAPVVYLISMVSIIAFILLVVLPHIEFKICAKLLLYISILIASTAFIKYLLRYIRGKLNINFWYSIASIFLILSVVSGLFPRTSTDVYTLSEFVNINLFIISLIFVTFSQQIRFFESDIYIRRELEKSLRKSNQITDKYKALVDGVDVGILTTDEEGVITFANQAFCDMIGLSYEKIVGVTKQDYFVTRDHDKFTIEREKWASGIRQGFESEIKRKEKSPLPVYIKPFGIRNRMGRYGGGRFAVMDISSIKEKEKETKKRVRKIEQDFQEREVELGDAKKKLSEQNTYFESLLSTVRDIILVIDLKGNCTYINTYGKDLLGFNANELPPKRLPSFLSDMEEMHSKFKSSLNYVISNHEAIITTRNKVTILCNWDVRPLHDDDGKLTGVVCVGRDITEQNRIKCKLDEYEKNLYQVVEQRTKELGKNVSQLENILKIDEEVILNIDLPRALSNIAQAIKNNGWKRVFITLRPGFRVAAYKGIQKRNLAQFLKKHERLFKNTLDYLNDKYQVGQSYYLSGHQKTDPKIVNKDDTNKRYQTSTSSDGHDTLIIPVRMKGKILGFVLAFEPEKSSAIDETSTRVLERFAQKAAVVIENKHLYDTLKERAKDLEALNKTKSEFFANIAHEFRTPLTSILSLSSALIKRISGELNSEQLHQIQIIKRNGERLLKLINDNLNLVRMESGKLEANYSYFSLKTKLMSISDTIKPLCDRKKLKFDVSIANNIPEFVFNDEEKIEHVLINILSNAVKFCDRGKVAFSVSFNSRRNNLEFMVKDTGIGMDRKDKERIFRPFEQTDLDNRRKNKGSGLGLAIAKQFWEMIGGQLSVESKKGKGTIFKLTLPIREDALPISDVKRAEKKVGNRKKSSNKKILLVDDNLDNQYALEFILNDIGYNLILAGSGEEGIKKALKEKPALILMDMMMPGMDGYEATKRIKTNKFFKHVPIIAMTAKTKEEDGGRAIEAGCVDYLSKPFSSEQVVEKVDSWIE